MFRIKSCALLAIASAFAHLSVTSVLLADSPLPFVQRIANPQPNSSDSFSYALAAFNDDLLVGAPGSGGAAYQMDLNTGSQVFSMSSPDAGNGALSFGDEVLQVGQNIAVADIEFNYGSYLRDGSVYLFDGSTGAYLRTIRDPNPKTFGNFGAAMEYADGKLFVSGEAVSSSKAGEVYVFDPSNGQYLDTISNPDTNPQGFSFGHTLQAHQNDLYIGETGGFASGVQSGVVYRYDAETYTKTFTIPDPVAQAGASFGSAIAASDSRLLVGAPQTTVSGMSTAGEAYLFDSATGTLLHTFDNPDPQQFDRFGSSVAFFDHYVVIGAPGVTLSSPIFDQNYAGAFYVYDVDTGGYIGRVVDPRYEAFDEFTYGGGVVAVGDKLVAASYRDPVGSYQDAGAVYVYGVPEPSTLIYAGTAAATFGVMVLRRRRAGWQRNPSA